MQSSASSPGRVSSPWTELAERADTSSRQRPVLDGRPDPRPREERFERSLEQQRQAARMPARNGEKQAARGSERESEAERGEGRDDVQTQALTVPAGPPPAAAKTPPPEAGSNVVPEAAQGPELRTAPEALLAPPQTTAGAPAAPSGMLPGVPQTAAGQNAEIVAGAPQRPEPGSLPTGLAERAAAPVQGPAPARAEAPAAPPPTQHSPEAPAPRETLQLEGLRLEIDPDQRHARLDLEPAELGRVSVELELRAKSVRALLRVESKEALEALRNQLPELRQAFEARGLSVQELELSLDSRGADSGQRSPDQAPPPARRQRLRIGALTPSEQRLSALPAQSPRPVRPGGIDTLA